MGSRSKRYKKAAELVDAGKLYSLEDAVAIIKQFPEISMDESVDLAINLAVDPKHADQMVRGAIVLPHGIGKTVRVLVFAKGDKEQEARDAGADFVGGDDLAKKIQEEGWMDFDRVIASPDMMGVVGRLGKVLGPRGLMPNPKLGTVTPNVAQAVGEQKAGKVEFRVDKSGIIHCCIGKCSLDAQAILENASELIDTVQKARPATTKGIYMKKITVSTTMGPGLKVDPAGPLVVKAA
ncbi:MAG: 50S ribosomal protein L1 [Myxococcota bacterium]|nr:50S ribosomal protein L1 [Myxococcota bacterium]